MTKLNAFIIVIILSAITVCSISLLIYLFYNYLFAVAFNFEPITYAQAVISWASFLIFMSMFKAILKSN